MRYVSTRGEAPSLDFADALLTGLAHDGGLYVPETWPRLDAKTIAGFAGRPYAEVAYRVIHPFVGGAIADADLKRLIAEAYADFGHPAVAPIVQVAPNRFVLELFHGATLAFKDVAMQLLARLMDHVLSQRGLRATIAGATSGDTGGAAIEAFRGRERVDLVMLYPDGRVSDVQRRMMTTPTEANVHALAIDGTFDDCQNLVKAMFAHGEFRDRVRLAGVNSINWARIVAQIVYYFTAAVALGAPYRKVAFVVPTGNFGDIFAGYAAMRMGLPIQRLVVATNENDILDRVLKSGTYDLREVVATTSPSMDIQISSNFERLLFEAADRDAATIRRLMGSLVQARAFTLTEGMRARIATDFEAGRTGEAEVAATIRELHAAAGYLTEPHTAVALAVADRVKLPEGVPVVVLSTAHPAKFPDAVEAASGVVPALPARLGGLMTAPERIAHARADIAEVEAFIERVRRR